MDKLKTEMGKIKTFLFDLDGTLTDPKEGITNSVAYALERQGIKVDNRDELIKFIGPPLIDSFMKYYSFGYELAKESVGVYREYFVPKGMFENSVYDGVEDCLGELGKRGAKLVVATSKPEEYSVEILKHFGLFSYFDAVCGASLDETRTKKADVIEYALDKLGLQDRKDEIIMIGDREHDILGAKENGLRSIGVTYGYAKENELEEAGANYIVHSPIELKRLCLELMDI